MGMPRSWPLQDAKAKFSEVVKLATAEGPQIVTYRGVETAVLLSMDDFRRLEASRPTLTDYLLDGPKLADDAIALLDQRSKDVGREIDL
jgi:prevent-host-death family protein